MSEQKSVVDNVRTMTLKLGFYGLVVLGWFDFIIQFVSDHKIRPIKSLIDFLLLR